MTEETRDKPFTYRMSSARHTRLKIAAAERDMEMQEVIDAALDQFLGQSFDSTLPLKPKAQRERHALIDRLEEHIDHGNYATYRQIIDKLLATVKEDFPG